MGEIAEGILNGDFDSITGKYIGEGDGYPRTFTRTQKTKGSGIWRQSQAIIDRFPELKIKVLHPSGINVHIAKKAIITIWWQTGKWVNSANGKWKYFHDHDKCELEMIAIIEGLLPKQAKSFAAVDANNNVQACIHHLIAKSDAINKLDGKAELAVLLRITAQELTQYL